MKKITYSEKNFFIKFLMFWIYLFKDIGYRLTHKKEFREYGLTLYCGKQGAGKTVAMTEYLERMRQQYPEALIITNYNYIHQDGELHSWEQLLTLRNGQKGVIFAIDEIQNEYSSESWKNFPEGLLAEITQQRKQRIKIVGTSQVFTRVVKQLREQTFEVVDCRTIAGRWTWLKAFDAEEYNCVCDNPEAKMKLKRVWRRNFVQTKKLRDLYDSYAKIERMQKDILK